MFDLARWYGMRHVLIFVAGAIVGSFLNVCIYRIPLKQSIAFPGSHCPKCKHRIVWYDNIPILSYMLLSGKCGYCRARIPLHYIVVEILTAFVFLALSVACGLTPKFFVYAFMMGGLIVVSFIDLATSEIPDGLSLGGIVAALALSAAFPAAWDASGPGAGLVSAALGMLAGGGAIFLMGAVGGLVFKKEAMGGGDVKLMAAVGAFIGWKLVLLAFFIAPFFGALFGVVAKVRDGKETIPYGPFLAFGTLIAVLFGERIFQVMFAGIY